MRKTPISLTLPKHTVDMLMAIAMQEDRSKSFVTAIAIETYASTVLVPELYAKLCERRGKSEQKP